MGNSSRGSSSSTSSSTTTTSRGSNTDMMLAVILCGSVVKVDEVGNICYAFHCIMQACILPREMRSL